MLLSGWKDIANFCGVCVATAMKWKRQNGLPVYYVNRKPVADPDKIKAWLSKQSRA
ncbi:MAG: hypothetical protein JEY79_19475 [Pseudodesulfovibrio sp.]|nr:hypothetical protein [Pseudodesulfovibrio sp.]